MATAPVVDSIKRVFAKADLDGNGMVSRVEAAKLFQMIAPQLTQEMSDRVFDECDINDDGQLSYVELVDWIFSVREETRTQGIRKPVIFMLFDAEDEFAAVLLPQVRDYWEGRGEFELYQFNHEDQWRSALQRIAEEEVDVIYLARSGWLHAMPEGLSEDIHRWDERGKVPEHHLMEHVPLLAEILKRSRNPFLAFCHETLSHAKSPFSSFRHCMDAITRLRDGLKNRAKKWDRQRDEENLERERTIQKAIDEFEASQAAAIAAGFRALQPTISEIGDEQGWTEARVEKVINKLVQSGNDTKGTFMGSATAGSLQNDCRVRGVEPFLSSEVTAMEEYSFAHDEISLLVANFAARTNWNATAQRKVIKKLRFVGLGDLDSVRAVVRRGALNIVLRRAHQKGFSQSTLDVFSDWAETGG